MAETGAQFSRKILKALSQKTTWMGLAIIVNGPLLAFGVSPQIVAGIVAVVGGLAIIFQRQATQKGQDKDKAIELLTAQVKGLQEVRERLKSEASDR